MGRDPIETQAYNYVCKLMYKKCCKVFNKSIY